jgi:type II secretory pathway component GspD/PulD (secretin)
MRYFLFLTCLISFSLTTKAEPGLKVITLQHRFADDLLPSILPMVGEDGTATGMKNQLIIRVSPDRMPEVIMLIEQLDVARANRRITINTSNMSQSELNRTEVNGKVKVGNVTISNDRRTTANTANIEFERQLRNHNKNSSQFLTVLDGERAFISVGKIVPFTQEWRTMTRDYIQIDRTTDWHEISTGFAVRPRTIGNLVELEVTPRIANLNHQDYIDFETLSTTLRISLHEWVDIGGIMQNNDDVSRQILGLQNSISSQHSNLIIKVD